RTDEAPRAAAEAKRRNGIMLPGRRTTSHTFLRPFWGTLSMTCQPFIRTLPHGCVEGQVRRARGPRGRIHFRGWRPEGVSRVMNVTNRRQGRKFFLPPRLLRENSLHASKQRNATQPDGPPGDAQLHSATSGSPSSRTKNSRPASVGMYVLGIHGVGSWCSVIRSDSPCHCMPRLNAPSAPPMIRSAPKNNAGPIVFAYAGTSVVRLLQLVSAFCSIVNGCSRAPRRCVWAFHSASLLNSPAKCGSQNAMWQTRPMPKTVTCRAPWLFRRSAIWAAYVGSSLLRAKCRWARGTV